MTLIKDPRQPPGPPEPRPTATVHGPLPIAAFPAEFLMRGMVGWADTTQAAILITFGKGKEGKMSVQISDETDISQLMFAREYLSCMISSLVKTNINETRA